MQKNHPKIQKNLVKQGFEGIALSNSASE